MAGVTKLYSVHAIDGGTVIRGVARIGSDDGISEIISAAASEVDGTLSAIVRQVPRLTVTSLDFKTVMDLVWANTIPHHPFTTDFDVYLQEMSDAGTRTGNGIKLKFSQGILVPVSIGEDSGRTTITFEILPTWDGTKAPVVKTTGVALAVAAPGTTVLYKNAALKNNTTVLSQISDFSYTFGVTAEPLVPANSVWPTGYATTNFAPRLSFGCSDLASILALSNISGASAGAAGLIAFFTKYDTAAIGAVAAQALTLTLPTTSCFYLTDLPYGEGINVARYEAIGVGTDAAAPCTYATGVANPAETADPAIFTGGPVKHNTTVVYVASGSFSPGLDVRVNKDPAVKWPTQWNIMSRQVRFTGQAFSGDFWQALGGYGTAIDTGFHIYWRKHTLNSAPKADGTAEHIKITINAGFIRPGAADAAHAAQGSFGFDVVSVKGAGATATVSTASAIT